MSRRRPSRWLAPLAILVIGGATLSIVNSSGSGAGGGATTTTAKPRSSSSTTTKRVTRKVYVVRTGDTLSSISISTGVPVSGLQRLNPTVDVQALQPGQRLKLRS
ncbi:MAG TPA: LysM domain-containing protein [Solirubrobacteraceae bacterium]